MIQIIFIGPQTLGHSLGFPRKENWKQRLMHKHLIQDEIQQQGERNGTEEEEKRACQKYII